MLMFLGVITKMVTPPLLQEFVDYFGTAGVQHMALNTSDIISTVSIFCALGLTPMGTSVVMPVESCAPSDSLL